MQVPEGWEKVRIENCISEMKSGLSRKIVAQNIGLPVMISGNIQNNQLDTSELKYWYENDPQGADTSKYILNNGDILLCFINSLTQIGKACLFENFGSPSIYTTNLFRIISDESVSNKFLFQLITSNHVQAEIGLITKPAVNQASFTKSDFYNITVLLPPLPEQKKIAEVLSASDECIENTEKQIAKLKDLKKATMQDLLTKGIWHTEFKDSPLGRIPKSWDVVNIESLIKDMKSGLSRKIVPQDIGIPMMISGNIQGDKLNLSELKYWYKDDPQGDDTSKYILNNGDILLCFINSLSQIGKACLFKTFERQSIYTTNLFRIVNEDDVNNVFLFNLIISESIQREIGLITKPAVNQASFTKADFFNIKTIKPPLAEQEKIADILSSIDSNIENKEQKLNKLKDQKKALMNDLLTGKVRV